MAKTCSLFLVCWSLCSFALSQEMLNRDSMLRLLPSVKEDIAGVDFYISLGQQFENTEPELAKYYYTRAKQISRKLDHPIGLIKFANNYTYVLNLQGRYDSALMLNLEALGVARKLDDQMSLAKVLINTGTSYRNISQYEKAIQHYEEGKRIVETLGDDAMKAQLNEIMQLLYKDLRQYDRAIELGKQASSFFRKSGNEIWLASSLNNLGLSYYSKQEYGEALKIFNEVLRLGEKMGDSVVIASALLNLGSIYLSTEEYDKMEPYYQRALKLNSKIDADENRVIILRGLALVAMSKQQYVSAKVLGKEALSVARAIHSPVELRKSLETLSNIHYALHDMREAERYLKEATLIVDSILGNEVQRMVLETEKKFETEKKDLRINQLESEREVQRLTLNQRKLMNYVLAGGAVALLAILLLSFRNYRHHRVLQQRRIVELETEKQLMASEAVLKGEEQERTRLAKDLHDGLGGMLSGIKFTMNAMKENLIMTPDNAQSFARSMDMLDSSIREMRRVAHNLMPETLVKFGLDTALRDFCNDINQSGMLKVVYQSFGLEQATFDQTVSISIYRIIQELLNNSLKHAAAKAAMVQVSLMQNRVSVTVEDDGIGFDPSQLRDRQGMGWSNIQSRVDFLKGKLDLQSSPNMGTSVHIEFDL